MKKPSLHRVVLALFLGIFLWACSHDFVHVPTKKLVLPDTPYNYSDYDLPEHFSGSFLELLESTPSSNPTTDHGATLGRVLFYDNLLSANQSVSCASCHHQEHGFSDFNEKSEGFDGEMTARNSMHLVNLRYNRRLFWDTRAQNLEQQVLMPIEDVIEMGMDMPSVIARIEASEYYPPLFENAFGTSEVSNERISRALAQFVRSIMSYNTKYDVGRTMDFANYTEQELMGKDLFFNGQTRCNQCHASINFHNNTPINNGLDSDPTDLGQGGVTGDAEDEGQFKVPSLRNSAVSAPYMHDGRFATLLEVIEHYNSGVQAHPNLDDRVTSDDMTGGIPYQLNLTQEEKEALVAFLHTLTDHEVLTNPKWSDPFIFE